MTTVFDPINSSLSYNGEYMAPQSWLIEFGTLQ